MEALKDAVGGCPQVAIAVAAVVLATLYMFCKLICGGRVKNFQDKYVIITGCDSGFGKLAAIRLDHLGFNVIATCLTGEGEKSVREEASEKLTTFRLNVTKSDQVQEIYRKVKAVIPSEKGLWGVINNAGIAVAGPVDWVSLEGYKRSADVNLWGMIDVTKTFLPFVKKTKGRIINVVSIAGRASLPHASAYCVSKFGAEAFCDALRREMTDFDVKVSIIEPGFFQTEMVNRANLSKNWSNVWNSLGKEQQEEYGEECYQTYVENSLVAMVDICCSPNTYKVIDAIEHAVTSVRPNTRYVIGWDARLLWIWLSRLPTRVGDAILRMLTSKRAVPRSVQR